MSDAKRFLRQSLESNPTETTLSIRLPLESLQFAEAYGIRHVLTTEESFNRYLTLLKEFEHYQPGQSVLAISGLVPSNIDAKAIYKQYLTAKYKS